MSVLAAANRLVKSAPNINRGANWLPKSEMDGWDFFGFSPEPHQLEMSSGARRFRVDVVHRRGGKTVTKLIKLLTRAAASTMHNARFAYLAPTYSQAEDIAWAYLIDFAKKIPNADDPKQNSLSVAIPNAGGSWSRVRLYGIDSPKQRLRGGYLDGGVADEFQDFPEHVFTDQLRPMLADRSRAGVDSLGLPNQFMDFIGTPKGRNLLYRLHQKALAWGAGQPFPDIDGNVTYSDEWAGTLFPASSTAMVDPKELNSIRAEIGPTRYAQEFECSFDAAIEGAVYLQELEILRKMGRMTQLYYNPNLPVHTAWDLGWNDNTAIWFFQLVPGSDAVLVIDYDEFNQTSIPGMRARLAEKPYLYGNFYMPHDVRQTMIGPGKTREAMFLENGMKPVRIAPKVNLPDQLTATRGFLMRCTFDAANCAAGLDRLATYHRTKNKATGELNPEPVHDDASHGASALATAALQVQRSWSSDGGRQEHAILD